MDFQRDVIEKSKTIPVIVDFWAPWCGPCQYLGPVLVELASEAKGRWELVKVNVDENQDVASQFGIGGIPDVQLFVDGKSISKFTGALPKHQIQNWLEENLPDERKEELKRLIDGINEKDGIKNLEQFVDRNKDLVEGRLTLAEQYVFSDPKKAEELLQKIETHPKYLDRIDNIKALVKLMTCQKDENENVQSKLDTAKTSLKNSEFEPALQSLIEAVTIDKDYCDELPRVATIAVFHLLGEDHDLTQKYRRRFNMALY